MKLGYNTNGFAHHRLEDALAILAELGYETVALTLDYHALNPFSPQLPKEIHTIRRLLDKYKLHSVIETGTRFLLDPRRKHQPTLLSPVEEDRQRRIDFLTKAMYISSKLGSDAVSFWSGASVDDADDDILFDRLVEGCQFLCTVADEYHMRLAFEPEPGMFIDTMTRYAELVQRIDHPLFGLTLDIGHLHCQGEVPISEHVHRWRAKLWNVHIEDMRFGVHDHLMFGEGEIDFPPVLQALQEIGYNGGVHVELSRHSHNAVAIAREALAFLRTNHKI